MGVRGEALQRVNRPFPGRDNGQQPARSRFNLRPGQDSVSANAELVRWTGIRPWPSLDLPAISGEPLSLGLLNPRTLWGFCSQGPNAGGRDYKSRRYIW
jgi:hypothetical protein